MKKFLFWILKAGLAGLLAITISSAICLIYYNPGIHVTNETGATDYRWQSNSFQSGMTEGIAWNHTDKNGFYNGNDAPDINMNVLIMGSSNMEGTHVFTDQNTPQLLSELSGLTVYNIGTSGHNLLTCVKNLDNALSVMQPTDYVIIEIGSTTFSAESIDECLSGKMESIPSYDSGLLFQLQKIPYLKLVYAQLKNWNVEKSQPEEVKTSEKPDNTTLFVYYYRLAQEINQICETHGVKPIIFYHPGLSLNYDGSATAQVDGESLSTLQSACSESNIIFVDLSEDFLRMYSEECVLPNGFCNTAVGYGHLNKYGNRAIAQRLASEIKNASSQTEDNGQ